MCGTVMQLTVAPAGVDEKPGKSPLDSIAGCSRSHLMKQRWQYKVACELMSTTMAGL